MRFPWAVEFERLIQQPESQRDDRWEQDFLEQFSRLKVQLDGDQAKQGPDGWPYLFVRTGAGGKEPVTDIVRWLAGRGIGMVVNAHKMVPDYVFPYGMLWNFVEHGRFTASFEAKRPAGDVVFAREQNMVFGPPSDRYMPPYVRGVMREFLRAQGFEKPKVLVATTPDYKDVDLLLSLDSLGGLPKPEQKKFAEMMAWFLPLHYTFVLGDEKDLPKFHDL